MLRKILGLAVIIFFLTAAIAAWYFYPRLVDLLAEPEWTADRRAGLGQFGDSFGSFNALFTAITLVVNGILAWFTYNLWKDARDSAESSAIDTKKAISLSETAANAAVASAAAAQRSVEITQDVAYRELRAYVLVESPRLSLPAFHAEASEMDRKYKNKLSLHYRNFGKTPARQTFARLNLLVRPKDMPVPDDYTFPDLDRTPPPWVGKTAGGGLDIGAGTGANFQMTLSIEEVGHFHAARQGHLDIYLYGQVDYQDIFENIHKSEFFMKYDPNPAPTAEPFSVCAGHNNSS